MEELVTVPVVMEDTAADELDGFVLAVELATVTVTVKDTVTDEIEGLVVTVDMVEDTATDELDGLVVAVELDTNDDVEVTKGLLTRSKRSSFSLGMRLPIVLFKMQSSLGSW